MAAHGSAPRRAGPGTGLGRAGPGLPDCPGEAGERRQELRLRQAGAIKVFTDVRSGRSMDRPGLAALLAHARRGDTLAVVRLDRLGRSLAELLATVAMLKERGIALLSLEERIDTRPSRSWGALRCWAERSAGPPLGAAWSSARVPLATAVRTCSIRCAPRGDQRIC